ncbi:ATPase, partial [Streptomyces violaceoruber]
AAHEAARSEEHPHARMPGTGQQETATAPTARPALTSAVPAATRTTTSGRSAGAPALRLHRSFDLPDPAEAPAQSDVPRPRQPAGEPDDLPRRVRQASLAPQLRDGRPPEPTRPDPAHDDEQRTPAAVRDRMTAYRDGWSRGGGRRPGHSAPPKPQSGDSTEGDPA